MTLTEAYNILHLDAGTNDELVSSLIEAGESYIEVATGFPWAGLQSEPMVKTAMGLLLTKWYYADHADDQSLTRTVDALLKAITLRAREFE